jgi:hypothetical protein
MESVRTFRVKAESEKDAAILMPKISPVVACALQVQEGRRGLLFRPRQGVAMSCGCYVRYPKCKGNTMSHVKNEIVYCALHACAGELREETQKVVDWFKRMQKDHDEKLGKSFKEACENWGSISQEPLDMAPLLKALAASSWESK